MFASLNPPPLKKKCDCGMLRGVPCPLKCLHNCDDFPPFRDLPDEYDIPAKYYVPTSSGIYTKARHWCFMGEIIGVNFFIRPRAIIKTKFGEEVPVFFHLDDGAKKTNFFDWPDMQIGYTMCILYPYQHRFMDGTVGIRHEGVATAMVFPASLVNLTNLCDQLRTIADKKTESSEAGKKTIVPCACCGKSDKSTKRCSKCRTLYYCGVDCQKEDWKSGHKHMCRHVPVLSKLIQLDFTKFEGHLDWTITPEQQPTEEQYRRMHLDAIAERFPHTSLSYVRKILEKVEDMAIKDDSVLKQKSFLPPGFITSGGIFQHLKDEQKPDKVGEMPGFSFLKEFAELDSSPRVHVVDWKPTGDFSAANSQSLLLDAFLMALPMWHKQYFPQISIRWFMEIHDKLGFPDSYKTNEWESREDDGIDMFSARHRHFPVVALFAEYGYVLAEISKEVALKFPSALVVRVLRSTGNVSFHQHIRDIAKDKDTPKNVFTLWLREDCATLQWFKPLDTTMPLEKQLVDLDPSTSFLSRRFGARPENMCGGFPSDGDKIRCCKCQEFKAKKDFSKSQHAKRRRRHSHRMKCIACVS